MISVEAKICREAYGKKNLMFSTSFCNFLRKKHLHGDLAHFLVQHLASAIFFSDTNAELNSFLYMNAHTHTHTQLAPAPSWAWTLLATHVLLAPIRPPSALGPHEPVPGGSRHRACSGQESFYFFSWPPGTWQTSSVTGNSKAANYMGCPQDGGCPRDRWGVLGIGGVSSG